MTRIGQKKNDPGGIRINDSKRLDCSNAPESTCQIIAVVWHFDPICRDCQQNAQPLKAATRIGLAHSSGVPNYAGLAFHYAGC